MAHKKQTPEGGSGWGADEVLRVITQDEVWEIAGGFTPISQIELEEGAFGAKLEYPPHGRRRERIELAKVVLTRGARWIIFGAAGGEPCFFEARPDWPAEAFDAIAAIAYANGLFTEERDRKKKRRILEKERAERYGEVRPGRGKRRGPEWYEKVLGIEKGLAKGKLIEDAAKTYDVKIGTVRQWLARLKRDREEGLLQ